MSKCNADNWIIVQHQHEQKHYHQRLHDQQHQHQQISRPCSADVNSSDLNMHQNNTLSAHYPHIIRPLPVHGTCISRTLATHKPYISRILRVRFPYITRTLPVHYPHIICKNEPAHVQVMLVSDGVFTRVVYTKVM